MLIVGMLDSVHLANWLEIFLDEEIDFWLFSSTPNRRLHSKLKELLRGNSRATFHLAWPSRGAAPVLFWAADRVFDNKLRALLLRRMMLSVQANFVHALEFQNAGYLTAAALARLAVQDRPQFVATNYGSDIYWFRNSEAHRKRLTQMLGLVSRYAAECDRDVSLAKELGFDKRVMPVFPNAGGFTRSQLDRELNTAECRNLIMVKGYHGWVGRARVALEALELLSTELQEYEVVVYSCNFTTKRLAARIARRSGLNVVAYSKRALSQDEMLDKFSRAVVYVGLSLSDGISTSMLEAMAMGAVPVQTATACCEEWFSNTGVVIQQLSAEEVARGIRRAIELAIQTDAARKNQAIVRARARREDISTKALTFYRP